jgi:DMSO/TMAO reductase YedYZ heme-binding membrane subunit
MTSQLWWYVARASGIVAWTLASATVLWGLAFASRALGRKPRPAWLLDLHRFLGGLTVVFVGIHIGALVADNYLHFGRADILIPLASRWRPAAVAWGVVAMYLLVAVEVTSLLMKRLPRRLWRRVHLTSYVLYVSATVHLFTAGTDRTTTALRVAAVASMSAIVFLATYRRLVAGRRPASGGEAGVQTGAGTRASMLRMTSMMKFRAVASAMRWPTTASPTTPRGPSGGR